MKEIYRVRIAVVKSTGPHPIDDKEILTSWPVGNNDMTLEYCNALGQKVYDAINLLKHASHGA